MFKKISYLIYNLLKIFDIILKKLFKRSFLIWFKDFLENDSYKTIKILDRKISFFSPNYITNFLIDEFFTKEPETLEWIDNFQEQEEKIIFWDIGANIGLYSLYAGIKFNNIEVVSFEPSTSNLRILSRNISINNLEKKIKINQFPLSNVENKYLTFNEGKFIEGVAQHTWGEKLNFEGKIFNASNKYKIFGTSINFLLDNNILKIPNYIKIDVDGIEHLILQGASKYLSNPKIRSLSIELNENFKEQLETVFEIMKENNFNIKHKKRAENFVSYKDPKLMGIYNFVFEK